jgi:hypothetical protein
MLRRWVKTTAFGLHPRQLGGLSCFLRGGRVANGTNLRLLFLRQPRLLTDL